MTDLNKFERQWHKKLNHGFGKVGKQDIHKKIILQNNHKYIIPRINKLMKSVTEECSKKEINEIMTGCACTISKETIKPLREDYRKNKDLKRTHSLLLNTFRDFIKKYKDLSDEQVNMILEEGMGMAGILEGETVIATKIPKQFHEYYKTKDPGKKKFYYCHCPMIRDGFLTGEEMPEADFCLCGAGFYKDLWEYILDRNVNVSIQESLLSGSEKCKIKIDVEER